MRMRGDDDFPLLPNWKQKQKISLHYNVVVERRASNTIISIRLAPFNSYRVLVHLFSVSFVRSLVRSFSFWFIIWEMWVGYSKWSATIRFTYNTGLREPRVKTPNRRKKKMSNEIDKESIIIAAVWLLVARPSRPRYLTTTTKQRTRHHQLGFSTFSLLVFLFFPTLSK